MATSNADVHEDDFVSKLNCVRKEVQHGFEGIRNRITDRENIMLQKLNDMESLYTCYKERIEQKTAEMHDIEILIDVVKNVTMTSEFSKNAQDNTLTNLNELLSQIQIPVKPKLVTFVCEPDDLQTELSKFCKLVETIDSIDYSKKTQPLISVCCKGKHENELYNPCGVAVDPNTGSVYVTDQSNHCIKVFDSLARYVTKFGHDDGEGEMKYPRCLAIGGNRVFITQGNSSILAYQLDGKFIHKTGSFGDGDLQFNYPWGLTIDEGNRDLYVCDHTNNRVQILSADLQYISQFGRDILSKPRHIKLTKENVFILDTSSPCLHIFGKDLAIQKNVITRGEEQQVIDPHYFFIDKFGCLIVSDCGSSSILIFNSGFEILHRIAVSSSPMEVTMDAKDRLIVVCKSADNCLQLF